MTRVLVVEDERPLLRALAMNLVARGYAVTEAESGARALAALADQKHDAIVLDLGLPDISGVEVIKAVREFSATPIIVLSARSGSADKVQALDLGADDYVTKPFRFEELDLRVAKTLSERANNRRGYYRSCSGNGSPGFPIAITGPTRFRTSSSSCSGLNIIM